MKRRVLASLTLFVVIIASAVFAGNVIYGGIDEKVIPEVSVDVFGESVEPSRVEWHEALFGGLLHKEIVSEGDGPADLGQRRMFALSEAVVTPEDYDAVFTLERGGETVFSGDIARYEEEYGGGERELEAGSYRLSVRLEQYGDGIGSFTGDYGIFHFSVNFNVPLPDPEFFTGNGALAQGEVFVIKLTKVPEGVKPSAKTDLGPAVFMPDGSGEGEWFAAIPVGNTRAPGTYKVDVSAGEFEWETAVNVSAYEFNTQNLIIDTSNPTISEANSAEAYRQYREKIPPLFQTYDEELYWEGTFIWPATGRISTEFGSIRYTNSNWSNPRYHWGMDIAVGAGTPVAAPNNGRVVFSEYLLNTGNTIAIEHGGGLKSYYYHLERRDVNEGDTVRKGDIIGAVGSTGYSTGPHLHFEMRIGDQAINPTMLFEEGASMYAFEN